MSVEEKLIAEQKKLTESLKRSIVILEAMEKNKEATVDLLITQLKIACTWLEHGIPDKPTHDCANPDSNCDQECVDWVHFCDDRSSFLKIIAHHEKEKV